MPQMNGAPQPAQRRSGMPVVAVMREALHGQPEEFPMPAYIAADVADGEVQAQRNPLAEFEFAIFALRQQARNVFAGTHQLFPN
jgi:hypothetical protein